MKKQKPKLLLHSCCGPCSSSVLPSLFNDYDITVYFCNPNINSLQEFNKRLKTQKIIIKKLNKEYKTKIKLKINKYNHKLFLDNIKGNEYLPEGGLRCENCFSIRLDKTAQYAKRKNYDIFASTLTVSPHKDHIVINKIGNLMSVRHNISYLESNFKKQDGYKKSIEMSKKYNLYRQNYCGCEF